MNIFCLLVGLIVYVAAWSAVGIIIAKMTELLLDSVTSVESWPVVVSGVVNRLILLVNIRRGC
jgi:hypothetical protein